VAGTSAGLVPASHDNQRNRQLRTEDFDQLTPPTTKLPLCCG
jgi:hypothetical protein